MNNNNKVVCKTVIFIFAIIALIVGYWDPWDKSDPTWWWDIIPKVGEIVIVGGIIGFISNESTILSHYREELIGIIYENKYIKNRKDINTIWVNVSKEMFKSKFTKIHGDLLSTIQRYLPSKDISYYEDYEITTRIKLKENGIVEVTDESEFILVADSEAKFEFCQDNWVHKDTLLNFKLKVDGKIVTPRETKIASEQNKNEIHYVSKIDLKGKLRYKVEKVVVKSYNINDDNYIGFRSKYITNKFTVRFVLPDELKLEFTERGTQLDFKRKCITENTIEYKYAGLILPRQGYIAILQLKENKYTNNDDSYETIDRKTA